jgi:hypothetical protein
MCEPTVAFIALTALSAYSSAEAQNSADEYAAGVARNNEKVAEWQAGDAQRRGADAAAATRRKYAGLMGTQRANMAARGLDITDGSANSILQDTSFFGQYDENTVRANAAREAWGYKVQAGNFADEAAFRQASADGRSPILSGAMAGASAYFASGAGRRTTGSATAGSGSVLTDSTSVNPKWYGSGQGLGYSYESWR